jgi:hypothetical protein
MDTTLVMTMYFVVYVVINEIDKIVFIDKKHIIKCQTYKQRM